ncbi:hypothetical protein GCM10007866_26440 [Gluconobacter albidus]|uniref:Uncharacterized protein n=1 Tax=Gluconobacter albidus TaxID=318683 RepID=A0ABQ5X2Y6_9PROT|nr:hypothetical protein AA3250_1397 [Gluconobacter albidus NBRC 3250]GLQ70191.1 hypothetical protein GCM10007866_26440 [Gluconobacter albidus]
MEIGRDFGGCPDDGDRIVRTGSVSVKDDEAWRSGGGEPPVEERASQLAAPCKKD